MINRFLLVITFFVGAANCFAQINPLKYVDPLIGTGGHGHTFPGATLPFGMVQPSPDTRIDNWDGCSGYHYSDSTIYGFSHTHLSGTGVPDYCDVLLMPSIGDVDFKNYKSSFSHKNERASAGYYAVKLDNGVSAELTATTRVGVHRYTFSKTDKAQIIVDLKWRDKVLDSELKVVSKTRLEGYRRSESWARNQAIFFVIEFSKPFETNIMSIDDQPLKEYIYAKNEKNLKASFQFKTIDAEEIIVKIGVSAVSIANAAENLKQEMPDFNFGKAKIEAEAAWLKELAKIEIADDNTENLIKFYTAIYHTKIQPNTFQDVNGEYRGLDGKTHTAEKNTNYTVFSLWDTFRAAHPLYTITDTKRNVDFINTFIRQYEDGGRLPVWELAGNETDCMIGYHSVSIIADAMAKNTKGFDYEKAYAAAKNAAERDERGLKFYKKNGFISMENENESVSKTLEYAYDDYCIASMAAVLKKYDDYKLYINRAQSYKNLLDTSIGFMRPRQNGGFIKPFKPNEVTFHFTEGNSWVYSFFVPQDINGLITLQGGKTKFAAKLDELFTTKDPLTGREQPDITGLIGQYAHGNEPSHHIAYLYNFAGQPWKTQRLVRTILDDFYQAKPDGLIGNEDCGQMSAWFALSSMGFYQVAPSVPYYELGSPLFKQVKINLENGKFFTIKTTNNSKSNVYVQAVKLNGAYIDKTFFKHSDIENGGLLEFEMGEKPSEKYFKTFSNTAIGDNYTIAPTIDIEEQVFGEATTVTLKSLSESKQLLYSFDDEKPNIIYKKPFKLQKTAQINVVSMGKSGKKSNIVTAKAYKLPHNWGVKLFSKYNRQYTGGGEKGLIDGLRGTTNFASGEWQGYQAQDFVAVIDLKTETEVQEVGGSFLQVARSWIWMPTEIVFESSLDGENFTKIASIKTDIAPDDMTEIIKEYKTKIAPVKAKFLRIKAINLGKIPAWHPGAGDDAFIFVDEIFIN